MTIKLDKARIQRKKRIRSKISGTAQKPRLTVFKSNVAIYAQLIDDQKGVTIVAASSISEKKKTIAAASKVGKDIADAAKKAGIETCVFDRNGYPFHGRVKALAEAARESGLQF